MIKITNIKNVNAKQLGNGQVASSISTLMTETNIGNKIGILNWHLVPVK